VTRFGRDLYIESIGDDAAFRRDYGAKGELFPKWIASCAAADPAFASFLTENAVPIGLVVVGADPTDKAVGHVHHFYVRPSHRGRGFGGLLDDYARETLRRAGYKTARLNVTARNERALRFYVAQGWRELPGSPRARLRYMEIAL
jgi:GNAT superfamily N-acetyltransferase